MYPLHQRLHDETARKGIPKITSCGRDNLALRGTRCISLLLPFHRANLSYAATPACGEGQGEEMSTDFVEELAVPAQNIRKAFSAGAGIQ